MGTGILRGSDVKILPAEPLSLSLSGNISQDDAELPYQGSMRELHQSFEQNVALRWKISDLVEVQAKVSNQPTTLTYWDQGPKSNETQELEGQFKFSAEDIDSFLNQLSLEAGGRRASSDFSTPAATGYNWGWFGLQTYLKEGENLALTAKLQGQGGDGLNLPLKFYPVLDFMWRFFGKSQLNLYWRTENRYVDSFHNTFMDTEHISPEAGFPSPTEVTGEWEADLPKSCPKK